MNKIVKYEYGMRGYFNADRNIMIINIMITITITYLRKLHAAR